jgi:hypothetical protein
VRRFFLLLIALNALPASVLFAVNDVGPFYAVLKQQRYNQTDASAPTLTPNQAFRFSTFVSQAAGGTLTGGTVTPPNTGTISTAQPLSPNNDGSGSQSFEQRFDTPSGLNAAFGDGQYSLHITGANGTYNAQLTLSGEAYPGEIPQFLNTSFGGGALVIDPTQPFTVTWNSFADHNANDVVVFSLNDSNGQKLMQQILAPTATSQLIPANTLQFDQGYNIQLIFIKTSNTDTASIPGSTGKAGYGLSTKANVTTRGNLFASINGTAANGGGSIFQYTPAGTQDTFASGLDRPRGVAFDNSGNLFVAINTLDSGSGNNLATIVEITSDGTVSDFATGFNTNFFISGLATDSIGDVFAMAEDANDPNFASTIYKFTPDGTGTTFGSVPGQGFALAFDSAGNLYAADGLDQTVYKFTPTGTQTIFAGPAAFGSLQAPAGLAFDKFGNLFVSTEGNSGGDVILKFTPGGIGSTFATGLDNPRGLTFDSSGNLFVAEIRPLVTGDILEFDPTGTQTVFASGIGRPQGNGGPEFLACNEFPVIIGGNVSASGTVGQQFVYQIAATNHASVYNTSALPAGLSLDTSAGLIFGIPTNSGSFSITLSAWNPCGTGLGNLALAVQPAPSGPQIVSSTSATGRTGQPFDFQVLTSGTTSSARLSTSPLPPGLIVDPVSGLISGTPTSDGNFSISLTVTDGPASTSGVLQLAFSSDPDVPVITSPDSATLVSGQFFSYTFTADANATFSYIGTDGLKNGALPPGLIFDGNATISGTYSGGSGGGGNGIIRRNAIQPIGGKGRVWRNTITIRPPRICTVQLIATSDKSASTTPLNFFAGPTTLTASQPPDITVEATGAGGATVNFAPPTVSDGAGNNFSVTSAPSSGSTFPLGKTTVVCTSAADSSGAYAIVTFNVTVQDTTSPEITAIPTSITVAKQKAAKGKPQGAKVNFSSQLTATDIVDGAITPMANPPSGSFFPLGITTVNVTATDSHGNSAAARSFTVNVVSKLPKPPKPPTVTISVMPNSISEGGDATFTVTGTTTNPSQPVTINYQMSGSAVPAANFYTLSSGQITIPPASNQGTVTLHAISNAQSTSSETAVMTILGGSGYKVGKTKSATVTINNIP